MTASAKGRLSKIVDHRRLLLQCISQTIAANTITKSSADAQVLIQSAPKLFFLFSPGGLDTPLYNELTAHGGQRGLATGRAGRAQKEWASVSGWRRLNACGYERSDHCGCQNRDLCYQLCFRHCLVPLEPGEFLLGSPVASALIQSTRPSKRNSLCWIPQEEEGR